MGRHQTQERGTEYYVGGGIIAGLIAGMVMAMFVMAVTASSGMGLLAVPEMIGQTVLKGQTGNSVAAAGLIVHMGTSAVFGVIWGLVWRGIGRGGIGAVIGGTAYGGIVWLVMTFLVVPVTGAAVPGPVPPAAWFIAHLMFGFVLGLWPVIQAEPFDQDRATSGARA